MVDKKKPHVMIFVGTRPEAVKMAPVLKALRRQSHRFRCSLVSTGQHREMLQQALQSFDIDVDLDLAIMQPSQTLAGLTAAAVQACDQVLASQRPDIVLVQGDTTTVVAASLAAFYQRIPVGHVEAGLRTGDSYNPFPEEMNRSLMARLATYHFAPTSDAAANLQREGVSEACIHVTGNTVVDALEVLQKSFCEAMVSDNVRKAVARSGDRLVLVTCHRRESLGHDLDVIVQALETLARQFPDRLFFFPVHLNPSVRQQILPRLRGISNVLLSDPITYQDMMHCLSKAELVLTDSGGLQEEAPSFHVPCLVLRRTTERPEGIKAGFTALAPLDHDGLTRTVAEWLQSDRRHLLKGQPNPYGDGKAAERIVEILAEELAD